MAAVSGVSVSCFAMSLTSYYPRRKVKEQRSGHLLTSQSVEVVARRGVSGPMVLRLVLLQVLLVLLKGLGVANSAACTAEWMKTRPSFHCCSSLALSARVASAEM